MSEAGVYKGRAGEGRVHLLPWHLNGGSRVHILPAAVKEWVIHALDAVCVHVVACQHSTAQQPKVSNAILPASEIRSVALVPVEMMACGGKCAAVTPIDSATAVCRAHVCCTVSCAAAALVLPFSSPEVGCPRVPSRQSHTTRGHSLACLVAQVC